MSNLLNEKSLESIKETLQTELLKRGILAPITRIEEINTHRGSRYVEFETAEFQTTPVMFKSVKVANFNSWLIEEEDFFKVTIHVHYSYKHFEGGSNGCSLFDFKCKIPKGYYYLYDVQIS